MPFAVGNMDKTGDVAAQVQQCVQLDRGLGRAKRRPREHRQTQIDRGGVERIHRAVEFEAKRLGRIQLARDADQRLGELAVQAPVAPLVGVGQIASGKVAAQPQVIRLGRMRLHARFDVPQALAKGDLCERHAQELIQRTEGPHVEVAAVLGDQAPEGVPRRKLHHLRENKFARVHTKPPGKAPKDALSAD